MRKHRGKFKISFDSLRKPETLVEVMSQVVVSDAIANYMENSVTYYAYSYLFEEIDEHVAAPFYWFEFTRPLNGPIEVKAVKGEEPPL